MRVKENIGNGGRKNVEKRLEEATNAKVKIESVVRISTGFRVLHAPKAGQYTFFPFSNSLVDFRHFFILNFKHKKTKYLATPYCWSITKG